MLLTSDDVLKVAKLAELAIPEEKINAVAKTLERILDFVDHMSELNTDKVEPLAHPLHMTQRLRADAVTEVVHRREYQKIAPQTEAGLYLVPKVIE